MTDPLLSVGIASMPTNPGDNRPDEQLSEESVAEVAGRVYEALTDARLRRHGHPAAGELLTLPPRVKELNVDVLINLCEGFYGRPQWEPNVAATFELRSA